MAVTIWKYTQLVIASFGAFLGYFIGESDAFVIMLIIFMILDYFSAVILAYKERVLSSEIGFYGIIKKVFILAMVGIANLIDNAMFDYGYILRNAVVFFYLANEGLSIVENMAGIGLPLPENLKSTLKYLHKGGKSTNVEIKSDYKD